MNEVKISKKSWHYRLARHYAAAFNSYHHEVETNICGYTKQVISGAFAALLVVLLLVFLGVVLGEPLLYLFVWLVHGYPGEMGTFGMVGTVVTVLGLVWGGLSYLRDKYDDWRNEKREQAYRERQAAKRQGVVPLYVHRESFLSAAYRSIKDKMCFKLEMVD